MIDDRLEECDDGDPVEDRLQQEVEAAFAVVDNIHNESWSQDVRNKPAFLDSRAEEVPEDKKNGVDGDTTNFDPLVCGLYMGAKSSKVAATILLLNLYSIHGVSNCFVDELFSILYGHILPEGNSLPQNQYTAKALTRQLGLAYNSIHSCESSCVLFCGEYANETTCPKCTKPRFKDQERKKFPAKVLRHFFIIPHLQRMFKSPTISQLLLWHSENRSD
jgi:hypothetical protein